MSISSYRTDDLIAALATPRGKSAVALIRSCGPNCIERIASIFSRPAVLRKSEGNRVHHGWLLDENQSRIDEVLITVFRKPYSYTGGDSVEISSHGSPAVVDRIMDILRKTGFRDAEPGEFTFRAFFSGKMDLLKAEAVKEIVDARTEKARALAVSRLAGSIGQVVDEAKAVVTHQSAVAALALDYPDDEVEELLFDHHALAQVKDSLNRLIGTWNTGRLYHEGIRVALAGPANAGKSSLFNLFLKEERSIVTETPGTTRDWVEAWLNLDGIPLRLVDTAGLRLHPDDPVEREGLRRTRKLISSSDLVIAVADGSAGSAAAEKFYREEILLLRSDDAEGKLENNIIRVWNKIDQAPETPKGWIPVSALNGRGFAELEQAISSRAHAGAGLPETDAPVIESLRQKTLLERAVAALERFDKNDGLPIDLKAEDLRDALDSLGELTGEVSRSDVLNAMFGEFCVGK